MMMLVMTTSIYANPGLNCDSCNTNTETTCFNQDEIYIFVQVIFSIAIIFFVFMIGLLFITSFIFKKMFNHNIIIIISTVLLLTYFTIM